MPFKKPDTLAAMHKLGSRLRGVFKSQSSKFVIKPNTGRLCASLLPDPKMYDKNHVNML